MKKIWLGLLAGTVAGIIDVIPMIIQKLTWDANLSAFLFWIVAGFFISTTNIGLKGAKKGITISLILLLPLAIIIGWKEPLSLIWVTIFNLILGSSLGYIIDKFGN